MAIFQPVDVTGPANRGGTIQQLAQGAAQNVLRRQRMRALLAQGARGAAGGTQPFRSSLQARPMGVRGSVLAGVGRAGSKSQLISQMLDPSHRDGGGFGQYGPGGGGYDYPSLPDPNDASQSRQSSDANPSLPTTPAPARAADPVAGVVGASGQAGGNNPLAPSVDPTSVDTSGANGGLINLGGGLYYDPVTDAVHGGNPIGGYSALQQGLQGRPV
jgi:hypothetical protein